MNLNQKWRTTFGVGFAAILVGGCAQVDPAPDFGTARNLITSSTGEGQDFDPFAPVLTEEEIHAILGDGLGLEEALRLALINQRDLQASFHEIGIAHADWVQSQLLSNPSLDMLFRFSNNGGHVFEANAGIEILQLWRLSLRTESASANLDATILQIARLAGEYLTEARQAYFTAVAAQEFLQVASDNLILARDLADSVTALQSAGSVDALEQSLAQGPLLTAELAVRTARIQASQSKRALAKALSLTRSVENLELTDDLPSPASLDYSEQELVDLAWAQRLDLVAIGKTMDGLAAQVRLEKRKAWGDAGLGASYESTSGSDETLLGPVLNLELPIFDQNQAQVARAEYQWEQIRKLEESAKVAVAQDVRAQWDRVKTSLEDLEFYRKQVLPQAERSLSLARESYAAGRIQLPALVEVQRQLLEVQRGHITLLLESASSFAALELAVGKPL